MKKILSITFISLLIFTSVSYSEIKAKYKLKCKVFDFGNYEYDKNLDYYTYFDLDFVKSIFLIDIKTGNKTPNVKNVLILDKEKSDINNSKIFPHLWLKQPDNNQYVYNMSFVKEEITLSSRSFIWSENNKLIEVNTAKSLCNEVNSFK